MKTRDRIVSEARLLYNQLGFANVSSGKLANHLGMAEGNLWYHFKTKGAILKAISERFAKDIELRLALMPDAGRDVVEGYAALLRAIVTEFREYRFLYRDQADYGGHDQVIRLGAPQWTERTLTQLRTFYSALAGQGFLDWPEERVAGLAINATIILRYGLNHYREMGGPSKEGGGAVRNTLLRHLTLSNTDCHQKPPFDCGSQLMRSTTTRVTIRCLRKAGGNASAAHCGVVTMHRGSQL